MGAQLRLVRQRIGTVQSIAKITRAQELIASSRIVRAQQQQRAAEPYSRELTRAVEAVISRSTNITHPFTTEPKNPTRAAVLILTSDQGFAGAYNANVLREAFSAGQDGAEDASKVDEIHLVGTDFVSMLTQRPAVRRLLPLEITETDEPSPSGPLPSYEFEPDPERG